MPLLRNADRSKISKRKNPVSLSYYRRAGILPEALINFLGLMGWSFGNDVEVFTVKQMMEKFDFSGINLGGPVFDMVKLTWMNQTYMHKMDDSRFVSYLRDEVFSPAYLKAMKPLVLERMSRFEQFVDHNSFFFSGALDYRNIEIIPKGKTSEELSLMLGQLVELLDEMYEWSAPQLQALIEKHKDEIKWKPKDYFLTLRMITTGRKDSPPLFDTLAVLGREMVRFRIRDYVNHLASVTPHA
jgi:glutamyl-tRNA synthetase